MALRKRNRIEFLGNWRNDLIWCPSQLYRKFVCPLDGREKELYCRWRHQDPWTISIFERRHERNLNEPHFDSWVDLGSGLSQHDEIEIVHKLAEFLLHRHYFPEDYCE